MTEYRQVKNIFKFNLSCYNIFKLKICLSYTLTNHSFKKNTLLKIVKNFIILDLYMKEKILRIRWSETSERIALGRKAEN